MKSLIVAMMMVGAVAGIVLAEGAGSAGAQFLMIQPDARAKGMGDISVSLTADGNALYWNPAGLADITAMGVSATHMMYVEDLNYDFISAYHPIGKYGVLAIGGLALYSGKIDRTTEDESGNYLGTNGTFDTMESAIAVAWGKQLSSSLSLGVGIKAISQEIADAKASGFAGDLGLKYRLLRRFNTGLSVQNVGSDINGDPMPTNIKAGCDTKMLNNSMQIGVEGNYGIDKETSLGVGMEYTVMSLVSLRCGYNNRADFSSMSGIHVGVGFGIKAVSVDYALVPCGDIGTSHVVSIGMKF